MSRREMDEHLAGQPSKLLVRKVRSHLRAYGITPRAREWRLAWQWADAVANRDRWLGSIPELKKHYGRPRWPAPLEIGSQYLALLLARMKDDRSIRLPYHAGDRLPGHIAEALGGVPALPAVPVRAEPLALPEPSPASPATVDLFTPATEDNDR